MCFCNRHSYRADRLDWSVYAGADVVAASSRALRLEPQREYLRRLPYPSEDVGTKRFKPLSVGNRRGERGRNEDLAAERFAQRFDARNLVDRRADDCEVKAIDGADIAIEDLADVEGEIDDGIFPIRVRSALSRSMLRIASAAASSARQQVSLHVPPTKAKLASMPSPRNFSP